MVYTFGVYFGVSGSSYRQRSLKRGSLKIHFLAVYIPEFGESIDERDGEEVGDGVLVFRAEHEQTVAGVGSEGDGDGELFVSASKHRKRHVTRPHELRIFHHDI